MQKRFLAFALVLCALGLSVVALADDFDYEVANVLLLQDKSVQKDLSVSEAQRAKLNKAADWFTAAHNKLVDSTVAAQKSNPNAQFDKKTDQGYEVEFKRKIMAELTAPQIKRLREITIQAAGITALLDGSIQDKVGLTASQKQGISSEWTSLSKKSDALQEQAADVAKTATDPVIKSFNGTKPKDQAEAKARQAKYEAALKKVEPQLKKFKAQANALKTQFRTYMEKTLTPAQVTAFKALQGAPLKAPLKGASGSSSSKSSSSKSSMTKSSKSKKGGKTPN